MERRRFLSLLGLGVAGVALAEAIPLGRVWSFPSKLTLHEQGIIGKCRGFEWADKIDIGSTLHIRVPQRWAVVELKNGIYQVVPPEQLRFKIVDSYCT